MARCRRLNRRARNILADHPIGRKTATHSTNYELQQLINDYYGDQNSLKDFIQDHKTEKIAGDEMSIILLSKYLQRNITVIAPFATWTMYPSLEQDIILIYDGKFSPTQDLTNPAAVESKSNYFLRLFLNID